jgi:hypothetical protein
MRFFEIRTIPAGFPRAMPQKTSSILTIWVSEPWRMRSISLSSSKLNGGGNWRLAAGQYSLHDWSQSLFPRDEALDQFDGINQDRQSTHTAGRAGAAANAKLVCGHAAAGSVADKSVVFHHDRKAGARFAFHHVH